MPDSSDMMHGVVLLGHGGPDMLEYRDDLPIPQPQTGDVLIKMHAAGVNNTDINTRLAWYSKSDAANQDASWAGAPLNFPLIQGIDACGDIMAVGKGVSHDRIGERVLVEPCLYEAHGKRLDQPWFFGSECNGAFAEYTVVASRHAHRITSALSSVALASFPCSYSTAENMLTRAHVKAGDIVLVTGASGGVGSAAIQLAKARGAVVYAVTSPEKQTALKALGADRVLDRGASLIETLGANSVDVVIDLVAGASWPDLLDSLRRHGRYAVAGAVAGPLVTLDVRTLYLKDISFFGCTALDAGVFANLVTLIETDAIKPLVADIFPLKHINKAQQAFTEKNYIGKIVLEIASQ
ncbi:MAG: zinc-binding dehydrogenase [Candidatus Puniceispirillum sp.]|jgi:NADPH:quinone reductase-like Zn-dependent oxidoreductase|uniref:alcohol dehydrogenase family protein n=1 Tax=Candidatus Puniceispirillum sp. TaxID=2026719 RepID=UPI001EB29EFA|nr:zinc-binding dehydrogenase [Candidatus Puniceispirillum sp.]MBT6416403.1 zinc-binding dehydrogenase [Candidatus Puniceispirillum sp.]